MIRLGPIRALFRAKIDEITTPSARGEGTTGIIRDPSNLSDFGRSRCAWICLRKPHSLPWSSPACTGTSLRIQTIGLQRATSTCAHECQPRYILARPKRARSKEVIVLRKPTAIPCLSYKSRRSGTQPASRCSYNQRRCFLAYLRASRRQDVATTSRDLG